MSLRKRTRRVNPNAILQKAVIVHDSKGREVAFEKVTAPAANKPLLKRRYSLAWKRMVALYPPPHYRHFCDHSEGKEI